MARDGFLDNNYSTKSRLSSTVTVLFFSCKNPRFESGLESGFSKNSGSEPEFVNVYGAQEWVPRNRFRQPL